MRSYWYIFLFSIVAFSSLIYLITRVNREKIQLMIEEYSRVEKTKETEPEKFLPLNGIERELKYKIDAVKAVCGDVCDTSITGPFDRESGLFAIKKNYECDTIFKFAALHDAPDSMDLVEPFRTVPNFLLEDFSYNGRIKILDGPYFSEHFRLPDTTFNFGLDEVNQLVERVRQGDLKMGYLNGDNSIIIEGLRKMDLKNKRVLVIGSLSPWLEAMVLAQDAAQIVTLEYATINSQHPKISSLKPYQFIDAYNEGTLQPFDAMVTFSSLEHSGLGRFGDSLHPWGDLVAMARTWCVLKPGGMVLFGVPMAERDYILFNGNRCYGPVTASHALANFQHVWSSHPRFENTSGPDGTPDLQAVIVAKRIP